MKRTIFIFSLSLFVLQINAQDQTINGTTFKQDGKVGIGTTTPAGKLQVIGNSGFDKPTRVYLTNGASDYGRTNLILTGRMQGGNDGWNFGSNARNSIVFSSNYVSSGNENVGGIGLEQFSIQHEQNTNTLGILSKTKGNTPLLTVSQSGNIGLGTTNPATLLAIQGANKSLSVAFDSYNYSTNQPIGAQLGAWDEHSAAGIKFHRWLGSGTLFHSAYVGQSQYNGDYGLDFRTDNLSALSDATSSRMFISSYTGNVGIGTTDTQGFKLGVDGDVAATEVKIATYANWPDFVFKSTYNLPTLKEVEQHIKENGHLKNIPSAEEVKKDGFFLGDMNSKLLQKIEELTLYTIEQEKQIEASKKELQNQKIINKNLEERLQKIEALLAPKN